MRRRIGEPPTSETILDGCIIPDDLKRLNGFLDIWSEWVCYKQEEACDRDGYLKPWNSVRSAQKWVSQIFNQHRQGRNVIHVIEQSMLNEWIGIRFDLVPDPVDVPMPKSRDQKSALDMEWLRLQKEQIE